MLTHPRLPDLQHDGAWIIEVLRPRLGDQIASPGEEDASATADRRGLADAFLERRTQEQSRPSLVSAAVDWLFSGRARSSSAVGYRKTGSVPPGARSTTPAGARPAQVPPVDLGAARSPQLPIGARGYPAVANVRVDPSREESPQTPPAVRLQRRE